MSKTNGIAGAVCKVRIFQKLFLVPVVTEIWANQNVVPVAQRMDFDSPLKSWLNLHSNPGNLADYTSGIILPSALLLHTLGQ